MFGGFSATKLKPQLKMAGSRIQIASNKKSALLKQNMREIALLLAEDPPKEEKAKIRAEALIRDDNLIEAYEILQLECELLHERIKLIECHKDCPSDLVPVVSTLMWASQRVDIPELVMIRKQFRAKYGKYFEEDAMKNTGGILNERVVSKLSVEPPAAYLVQTYLERICEQYQVNWTPRVRLTAEQMIEPMAAPVGYSVAVATGTGLGQVAAYEASTGQPNTDEDIKYMKEHGGIPPPVVAATVVPNSSAAGGGAPKKTSDFEEPDIYVPGAAPTAPPGEASTVGMSSPSDEKKTSSDDKDDDDTNNGPAPAPSNGSSGGGETSYADLAARFEQLKK